MVAHTGRQSWVSMHSTHSRTVGLLSVFVLLSVTAWGAWGFRPAGIQSPSPGSQLPGPSTTFTWTPGTGATEYWLRVTSEQNGVVVDHFHQSVGSSLSAPVSGLPTDGRPVGARLSSRMRGHWRRMFYTYTAAQVEAPTEPQPDPDPLPTPEPQPVPPVVNGPGVYVGSSGNDSTGTGSSSAPYRTIGKGLSKLTAGSTLVIMDGTYSGKANFVNDGLTSIPSGAAGAYTVIRAENPLKVRIQNSGPVDYYDSPLRIRGHHIQIDGIVFDLRDQTETQFVGEVAGSYNKVTRSIFRRQGGVDQYGGWLGVEGQYHLVEDVAGVGAARYGFFTGGPGDTSHHIIFRRVVGRFDFSPSSQPKATFAAYGTDSGWGVHHILYQNCIAIDGQRGPSSGEAHYGAWYFPKNLDAGQVVGSIALNNAVAYSGMFLQELQGRNTLVRNSVSWATSGGSAIRWNGTGSMAIDRVTVGGNSSAPAFTNYNGTVAANVTGSLFVGNSNIQEGSGITTIAGSAFAPASQARGQNVVAMASSLRYLPDASSGTGLTGVGAVILKRIGRSGTLWDEAGYDAETTESLWPWPYEKEIKAAFAETNTPLPGNTPSANNTARGFTVQVDPWGNPMTLTRYVWQYLGNQIPSGIY
jgi:hypothetical protein